MAGTDYPTGLPAPSVATVQNAERRLLAARDGVRQSRPAQRDRLAMQQLTFELVTDSQCATWRTWWNTTLGYGGGWFNATWPLPQGLASAVRQFASVPQWDLIPAVGWRVSALCEVRGRGMPPAAQSTGGAWLLTTSTGNDITLSNANKTATIGSTGGTNLVIADVGGSAGNLYFEVALGGSGYTSGLPYQPSAGVSNLAGNAPVFTLPGSVVTGWVYGSDGGLYHTAAAIQTGMGVLVSGQVLMFALDLTNLRLWMGTNGIWALGGNPAAGTGSLATLTGLSTYWPVFGGNGILSSGTLRTRFSEFTYSPPLGFAAWVA